MISFFWWTNSLKGRELPLASYREIWGLPVIVSVAFRIHQWRLDHLTLIGGAQYGGLAISTPIQFCRHPKLRRLWLSAAKARRLATEAIAGKKIGEIAVGAALSATKNAKAIAYKAVDCAQGGRLRQKGWKQACSH